MKKVYLSFSDFEKLLPFEKWEKEGSDEDHWVLLYDSNKVELYANPINGLLALGKDREIKTGKHIVRFKNYTAFFSDDGVYLTKDISHVRPNFLPYLLRRSYDDIAYRPKREDKERD